MHNKLNEEKKEKIMAFIQEEFYKPMKAQHMAYLMQVSANEKHLFQNALKELENEGRILQTKKGKITQPHLMDLIAGVFWGHPKGFGFVTPDEEEYGRNRTLKYFLLHADEKRDIFIPPDETNGAMHKDRVLCRIVEKNGNRMEGEIVQILERGQNILVGLFTATKEKEGSSGFVVPDQIKLSERIFIPKGSTKGAVTGHKVAVHLKKQKILSGDEWLRGEVTEILGHQNDPGVDILSVVYDHDIPVEFSDEVMEEANRLPDDVEEKDLVGREDFRQDLLITIDGEDAKDLDDAVSFKRLDDGCFELGVHIADVTHYVREGSLLDKEAYNRGTSIYLANGVIPMLPHKLSNGICSLNPKVDRLTLSCIMLLDSKGQVKDHRIVKGIIRTHTRMSYTDVHEIVTNMDSPLRAQYEILCPMLDDMYRLSQVLKKKRELRGAIEFQFDEAQIILDKEGKAIDIVRREKNEATAIIEEFMLVCNETVAEEYHWLDLPFVYRIHEEPDGEKMQMLAEFVKKLGFSMGAKSENPKAMQKLLAKAEHSSLLPLVSRLALRSMKQARYAANNYGHYGLAASYYCHFTSPIRRYPDLQIHRLIKWRIDGLFDQKQIERMNKKLPDICLHCSKTERRAEETEREVSAMKKIEYMSDKIGMVFDGVVSGVTNWGMYVELANTVEGLVPLDEMIDDQYIFEEGLMALKGVHSGKVYSIGNLLKIKVIRANKELRRLDFTLASEADSQPLDKE